MERDDIAGKFLEFILLSKNNYIMDYFTNPLYPSMYVNYQDLLDFEPQLIDEISHHPDNTLDYMKECIPDVLFRDDEGRNNLTIRIIGFPHTNFRSLGSTHMNKFISLKGIIRKVAPLKPMVKTASFKCKECGASTTVHQQEQYLDMPTKCKAQSCEGIRFKFEDALSTFVDSQVLGIQESPEDLPAGQIPRQLTLFVTKDLVEKIRAGDIVTISGIVRIYKRSEVLRERTFEEYMDINNIVVESKESSELKLTEKEIETITDMAKMPNINDLLIKSFIPTIYGNEIVKEAILYLLVGGVRRETPDGFIRGELNVLLVGDPACAKSQLLKGTTKYSSRVLYTTGMGSSAVGLTAAVVKQDSGGFALEAGALVLGDKGVVCIDEMDKMNKDDRSKIHEAMEQHTVSISKAGIMATLNARCAILGAANPAFGRYDNLRTIASNLSNFPSTLLSRFDLIFLLKDKPEKELDEKMAEHILKMRTNKNAKNLSEKITPDFFKKYIAYAKNISPKFTPSAEKVLTDFYSHLRELKPAIDDLKNANNPIAITPRQLEALARIAEAHAKIVLRSEVIDEDARAAVKIMEISLKQVGINPTTGMYDTDNIEMGKSGSYEENHNRVVEYIRLYQEDKGDGMGIPENKLIEGLQTTYGMNIFEINKIETELRRIGRLVEHTTGRWRLVY